MSNMPLAGLAPQLGNAAGTPAGAQQPQDLSQFLWRTGGPPPTAAAQPAQQPGTFPPGYDPAGTPGRAGFQFGLAPGGVVNAAPRLPPPPQQPQPLDISQFLWRSGGPAGYPAPAQQPTPLPQAITPSAPSPALSSIQRTGRPIGAMSPRMAQGVQQNPAMANYARLLGLLPGGATLQPAAAMGAGIDPNMVSLTGVPSGSGWPATS